MLSQSPRSTVQELGRKHGPDKQMRTQHSARNHDAQNAHGNKKRQELNVGWVRPRAGPPFRVEQPVRGGHPPDGAGPVAYEGQDRDDDNVVAAHGVVGAREVD